MAVIEQEISEQQRADALREYFAKAAEGVASGTVHILTGMGDVRPVDETGSVQTASLRRQPLRRAIRLWFFLNVSRKWQSQ